MSCSTCNLCLTLQKFCKENGKNQPLAFYQGKLQVEIIEDQQNNTTEPNWNQRSTILNSNIIRLYLLFHCSQIKLSIPYYHLYSSFEWSTTISFNHIDRFNSPLDASIADNHIAECVGIARIRGARSVDLRHPDATHPTTLISPPLSTSTDKDEEALLGSRGTYGKELQKISIPVVLPLSQKHSIYLPERVNLEQDKRKSDHLQKHKTKP